MKLWKGRSDASLNKIAEKLNSSIEIDSRLYKEDILGSIAHVNMLAAQKIISKDEAHLISKNLEIILKEIENGKLEIDYNAEDIHTFVEEKLISRIGMVGKKLHTSRSRNDQVALDVKLYIKSTIDLIAFELKKLIGSIIEKAKQNLNTAMPGYTHLQRAQVVSFAHYILAYAQMFARDLTKLQCTKSISDYMPLGSCALAGSPYPIDRQFVAKELDFSNVTENSIDTVADRDHILDLLYNISLIGIHLSRLSEEIILWSSSEFSFIELSDNFSTGSSIMPQKKNPDIAEIVRGKAAKYIGNLNTLQVILKGLPLAYNKDLQDDKAILFDSVDNILLCLSAFTPMIDEMKVNKDKMLEATKKGFLCATDCADYLVNKGMPFRDAYAIVGSMVKYCIENNKVIEELSIKEFKEFSTLFEKDIFTYIQTEAMLNRKNSYGGTAPDAVSIQILNLEDQLAM